VWLSAALARVLPLTGEAGKTGTTNNNVDLWFIGYIPSRQLVSAFGWETTIFSTSGSSAQAAD